MNDGHYQFPGRRIHELRRLDRVLAQVARPVPSDAWSIPFTSQELMELGLLSAAALDQKALIEQLWGRKRLLLRTLEPDTDGGSMPPVA